MTDILLFKRHDQLRNTEIFQTEDGTLFYKTYTYPNRIFVKYQGNEINAVLPFRNKELQCIGTDNNALYFESSGKIYKASFFSAESNISVDFVRDVIPNESFCKNATTIMRDDGLYAYRISDDPNKDPGYLIDIPPRTLEGLVLNQIHGNSLIFISTKTRPEQFAYKLKQNIIVFNVSYSRTAIHADDCFIYIGVYNKLYILETTTMQFFHSFIMEGLNLKYIGGICNGEITVKANTESDYAVYVFTAQIPLKHELKLVYGKCPICLTHPISQNLHSTRSLLADSAEATSTEKGTICDLKIQLAEARALIDSLTEENEKVDNAWKQAVQKNEKLEEKIQDLDRDLGRVLAESFQKDGELRSAKRESANIQKQWMASKEKMNEDILIKLDEAEQKIQSLERNLRISELQHQSSNLFVSKFSHEFEIEKPLGAGSFGVVFKVMNSLDACEYAVKRIAVEPGLKTVDMALGEVRAMAKLEHPGIVRYNSTWIENPPDQFQADVDDDIREKFRFHKMPRIVRPTLFIYIQMQLCQYSLEWRLNYSMKDTPRKSWFKQMVSAVGYIHNKGLIHRDLKPSNILFVDDNHLKICDLGIVAQLTLEAGVEVEDTRSNKGTPLYMAPEQGCPKYDSKVDVFALGLILAEMGIPANQKRDIFYKIRYNKPLNTEIMDADTIKFVAWLTKIESAERPTCEDILKHAFLKKTETTFTSTFNATLEVLAAALS